MKTPTLDENGLEVLTRTDCLAKLSSHEIGRVSTTLRALPAVFPVHYALDVDSIVYGTVVGTKFHAATRQSVVAFEVDDFDRTARTGWSVLVVGQTSVINDPTEIEQVTRLGLEPPWIPAKFDAWIRISIVNLTGRRIPTP